MFLCNMFYLQVNCSLLERRTLLIRVDIDETTSTEIPFVFRNTVVSMIGVEFPLSFSFFRWGEGVCITAKKVDNICILSDDCH